MFGTRENLDCVCGGEPPNVRASGNFKHLTGVKVYYKRMP